MTTWTPAPGSVLRYQDLKFFASKVLGSLHREPFFFWLADLARS